MTHDLKHLLAVAGFALFSTIGLRQAQAANLLASETAFDIATFVAGQFDVTAFTFTSSGESATGSGAFVANSPATGRALVVLTEPGGGNSDWLELIYSSNSSVVSLTAFWRSDDDVTGLPPLPTDVTPQFLLETGGVQDVTALLVASAAASGFAFPSNITIQVQSDVGAEPAPVPASFVQLSIAFAALGGLNVVRRYKRVAGK